MEALAVWQEQRKKFDFAVDAGEEESLMDGILEEPA